MIVASVVDVSIYESVAYACAEGGVWRRGGVCRRCSVSVKELVACACAAGGVTVLRCVVACVAARWRSYRCCVSVNEIDGECLGDAQTFAIDGRIGGGRLGRKVTRRYGGVEVWRCSETMGVVTVSRVQGIATS